MTSRERVRAALHYQPPDRVPIDCSGHRSSGIAALAYARLRKHLRLEPRPIRVYDPIQQLAIIDQDVLDRFGIDTIELGRAFALDEASWADWVLPDGTACKMPAWALPQRDQRNNRWVLRSKTGRVLGQMPDGSLYFDQVGYPLADNPHAGFNEIVAAMDECMWTAIATPSGPLAAAPGGRNMLAEGAAKLRQSTDRAILGLFGGNLLEMGQFLFGHHNFFIMLASQPDQAHAFLDHLVEIHLGNLEQFLKAVGAYLDVIVFGDDLGMQSGPQISPAMYREFFKPQHAKMWHRAKELAAVKVMLHCCGGVRELLPDLIDAGLEAINPVQISARGMDLASLKRDFGGKIVFWGGGCDTQRVLPTATPHEVARHVRQQVSVFGNNGGFVFQPVHNIMANVPPANIVAMFDAVNS